MKKEIEIFNNTFNKAKYYEYLGTAVKKGNFSLSVVMFSTPPISVSADKKQLKYLKELRNKFQSFFKEKRGTIPLGDKMFIASIPEQLAKLIQGTCRPVGYNYKAGFGGELFSLSVVHKAGKAFDCEELNEILRIFFTVEAIDFSTCSGAFISFDNNKIRQIVPVTPPIFFLQESSNRKNNIPPLTLEHLEQLAVAVKNYFQYDRQLRKEVDTGLRYLERIQNEDDPHIKLNILQAALEYYIQSSSSSASKTEEDSRRYFLNVCREVAGRIGIENDNHVLFDDFYVIAQKNTQDKHYLKSSGATGSKIHCTLNDVGSFFREFIGKTINDANFLKHTLPKLKASQKKELKKNNRKKRWRKFPGKYIDKLFQEK